MLSGKENGPAWDGQLVPEVAEGDVKMLAGRQACVIAPPSCIRRAGVSSCRVLLTQKGVQSPSTGGTIAGPVLPSSLSLVVTFGQIKSPYGGLSTLSLKNATMIDLGFTAV